MDLGALQSRAQSGKKAVSNVECTCSNQQIDGVGYFVRMGALKVYGSSWADGWLLYTGRKLSKLTYA